MWILDLTALIVEEETDPLDWESKELDLLQDPFWCLLLELWVLCNCIDPETEENKNSSSRNNIQAQMMKAWRKNVLHEMIFNLLVI